MENNSRLFALGPGGRNKTTDGNICCPISVGQRLRASSCHGGTAAQGSYRPESPEIKVLRFPGLESSGKRHRSWKSPGILK